MKKIKKIKYYLHKNPKEILAYAFMKIAFSIPDRYYLRVMFRLKMGRKLNLKEPKTFNEKLQWLKLYDRKSEYTNMVDKYEAKIKAARLLSDKYIIPTLGVWTDFDMIDFKSLPNQFVLKTTNGGGNSGVVICKDKLSFNLNLSKQKLNRSLNANIYRNFKEWPYKNVKPRIIAEKYLSPDNCPIKDYKFYCFNGVPKIILVVNDRESENGPYFDYFDMKFNHLPYSQGGSNYYADIVKPQNFEEMIRVSKILSKGISQVRIDLYNVNGDIYFGEWTFFDDSGFAKFNPEEWDRILGDWIILPKRD